MTVHVNGNLTRSMNPGDVVHLGGIFLPIPYTGFQAIRAGLLTDSYLETHHIDQLKKQYNELEITPEIERKIVELQRDSMLYETLSQSIAPEIYGHKDIKKALLLLLVGGVTKVTADGMKIRGDINICLMGDPGVAKSQLLKFISKIAPRGVYTTGKGSSGVGLTAAVMRDPVTDEMVLGLSVNASNFCYCSDYSMFLQKEAHWFLPTTEFVASTSSTKWRSQTERLSTRLWSNKPYRSIKLVYLPHSMHVLRSWQRRIPSMEDITRKFHRWRILIFRPHCCQDLIYCF